MTDYDTYPSSLNGLLAAALGQRRLEQLRPVAEHERVVITTGAMLDLCEVLADLRARVALLERSAPV